MLETDKERLPIGPTRQTSRHVPEVEGMQHQEQLVAGTIAVLLDLTQMPTALVEVPARMAVEEDQPVDLVMVSGEMGNISLALRTHGSNVNFLESPMIPRSCRLVSTSQTTMTYLSKRLAMTLLTLYYNLPTLLWMITYFPTSNLPATRHQRPSKNILFLSSWVVEI